MHGKAWTPEDDEMLRNLYPYEDTRLVAEKIGRSLESIRGRARDLKIKKTKEAYDRSRRETYKKEGKEVNKLPVSDVPIEKAYMNERWLRHHYISLELPSREIAEMTGVEKTTILRWMKEYGIDARLDELSGRTHKKMSEQARNKRGPKTSRWNGGRRKSDNGYIYILQPDHPNVNAAGCVAEHRLVMEFVIARLLEPEEVVHHRDSNRSNNFIANLFVFPNDSTHAKFHQYKRYKDSNITEEEFMELISRKLST